MRYTKFFILILWLASCSETPPMATSPMEEQSASELLSISEQQFAASDFALGKVSLAKFEESLKVNGTVYLPESKQAIVSTLMPGTLGPIRLAPGQWVQKGQVLFRVTNPVLINLQQDFLIARENVELLREEYLRQQELAAANISLKKDLLAVQTNLRTTEVKVTALAQKLKLYGIDPEQLSVDSITASVPITAPISGYVADIYANEGMFLEPGVKALAIRNTNGIQLRLNLLEKDWAALKKGQLVQFSVPGNTGKTFRARIQTIQPMVDEQQMIPVYCTIEESAKKSLVSGMFVTAQIVTTGTESMALPEAAVVKLDRQYFVLKLVTREADQLQFEKIPIEERLRQQGMVQVENTNWDRDDQFLVKGAYYLVLE